MSIGKIHADASSLNRISREAANPVALWQMLLILLLLLQFIPLFSAILTGRFETTQDANDASGSTVLQVISVAMFLGSVTVARLSNVSIRQFLAAVAPVALMLFWIFASITWSHYPDLTAKRGIRISIEIATIVLLALSAPNTTSVLRILFLTFVFINILDLGSLFFPAFSESPIGFAGVHIHKNSAGTFFFLAIPIFGIGLVNPLVSRLRTVAAFSFFTASAMLAITLSKSAIGISILSLAFVALLRALYVLHGFRRAVLEIILVLCAACIVLMVANYGLDESLDLVFGDSKLTGRDQIWRFLWYLIGKSPLLGAGYGAVWQTGPQIDSMVAYTGATWVPNEGHNGYLDILAQLGFIGMGFLVCFLVIIFRRLGQYARLTTRHPGVGFEEYALYILFGALIYNITESSFFRSGQEVWFMLIFVATSASVALTTHRLRQVTMETEAQPSIWHQNVAPKNPFP